MRRIWELIKALLGILFAPVNWLANLFAPRPAAAERDKQGEDQGYRAEMVKAEDEPKPDVALDGEREVKRVAGRLLRGESFDSVKLSTKVSLALIALAKSDRHYVLRDIQSDPVVRQEWIASISNGGSIFHAINKPANLAPVEDDSPYAEHIHAVRS